MKTQHLETEVLVVGAGPVGMLTALLLGEGGVKVHLIDQESRTAARSYACALHPQSIQLLDRAGVAIDVISLGWCVDSVGIYEGARRHCELKLNDGSGEFPYALVLPQSGLEDFLELRLRQLPNVTVQWNHQLEDLETDGHSVTATVNALASTGKGYGVPDFELMVDKQAVIKAEFVVGADGHDSLVRQRLGIGSASRGDPELFLVYEFETDGEMDHQMKVALHQGALSALWPQGENRCRWSFQLFPPDPCGDFPEKNREPFLVRPEDEGQRRKRLIDLLRERAPWFTGTIKGIEWCTVVQFDHWVAKAFGTGRCWLAGDASHQTGPVGMQSMNAGLGEAADLAAILKRVLRHQAPVELLQSYEDRHHAQWNSMLGMAGAPRPGPDAPGWIRDYAGAIAGSLPATGPGWRGLLGQLGLVVN